MMKSLPPRYGVAVVLTLVLLCAAGSLAGAAPARSGQPSEQATGTAPAEPQAAAPPAVDPAALRQ
jgi:hypothetical protein